MTKSTRIVAAAIGIMVSSSLSLAPSFADAAPGHSSGLVYDDVTRSPVPIPDAERGLQTVTARPLFKVTGNPVVLEGPSFERSGNLVFSDATEGRVQRLALDGTVSTIASMDGVGPGGLAVHRDGRIFVAVTAERFTKGWIEAMAPDGSNRQMIVPPEAGYVPNDLVFDAEGGFYFTDFRGS